MPTVTHTTLREFGTAIFQAAGVPEDQARLVTDHLVESHLVGRDSHGFNFIPGYVDNLLGGTMFPLGYQEIVRETPASCVVNANGAIGVVMAQHAMQMAIDRAKQHTLGAVAVYWTHHIGRLGAFAEQAARQDCIGLIMLNGVMQMMAPFGGTGRRLPPNPIAIAVPTLQGPPLALDISLSMAAGGKVYLAYAKKASVPEGWLIDGAGNPVTDPAAFAEGTAAMLPLGGPVGHKGYGLAVMIDAIVGGLSWAGCSAEQPTRGANGFLALAIKIESFIDVAEYKKEVQRLIDWLKSSPTMPGVERIYLPGEQGAEKRRQREAAGVFIEETVWNDVLATAAKLNIPEPTTGISN